MGFGDLGVPNYATSGRQVGSRSVSPDSSAAQKSIFDAKMTPRGSIWRRGRAAKGSKNH